MPVYRTRSEIDFRLEDLPAVARPDRVLLADPTHFDVEATHNPYMLDEHGNPRRVDQTRARKQWLSLKSKIDALGLKADVMPAVDGLPDLVFCANQALPVPPAEEGGAVRFVPGTMAFASRAREVPVATEFLEKLGFAIDEPVEEGMEATGDGLWHPGRRLLWAGVGPRSSEAAWEELAGRYGFHVVLLQLADDLFYHLDTGLCPLDERTCLWAPEAFDDEGRELVTALFERCIEADEEEARALLACNSWCPDGKHVLIQKGCEATSARLREAGFEPEPLDLGEFLKSGGAAFCMKLAYAAPAP